MKSPGLIVTLCTALLFTACSQQGEESAITGESINRAPVNDAQNDRVANDRVANDRVANDRVTNDQDIHHILGQAEAAHKTAMEKKHAWIATSRLLASARKALSSGDEDKALFDARRALFTARASVEQAKREASDWRARVPK